MSYQLTQPQKELTLKCIANMIATNPKSLTNDSHQQLNQIKAKLDDTSRTSFDFDKSSANLLYQCTSLKWGNVVQNLMDHDITPSEDETLTKLESLMNKFYVD